MGTFTIPLKQVIELTGGTTEVNADGIRVMNGGNIGLSHYRTHVTAHKMILDGLIIDHYWNREIGQESVDMFQLAMRRKMNEIMPYYNQLYASELLKFDPLHTINIHTLASGTEDQAVSVDSDAVSDSTQTSKSRTVSSELPQTMLAGNADYATSGADANSESTGTTTGVESKESESVTERVNDTQVTGYQAYPANLLQQFRATFLNIDMMIVNELDSLFMQIWNNSDDYTGTSGTHFIPFYNLF